MARICLNIMFTVKVILPNLPLMQTNSREILLKLANGNIKELIDSLKTSIPLIADVLFDGTTINNNYLLAVNNEMIAQSEDIMNQYLLKDGDEITFVFAMAGG